MANFQYVTLVPVGGQPVRLADQTGSPIATTGTGALVFSNGATLTNVTITGSVNPFPLGAPAGTALAPSLYFVTTDRGIFSQGANDVSVASGGNLMASFESNQSAFYYAANGLQLKTSSDTVNEVVVQGYNTAGTVANKVALQKYGSNVTLGANAAPVAGGSTTNGNFLISSASVLVGVGTGAPTISAAFGSLYMRQDTPGGAYLNVSGSTTWDKVVTLAATQTLTNKTLTSPTINGGTITGATISGGSIAFGQIVGTSNSPQALAVGPNGLTNPAFDVDASAASLAAGLKVVGAASGGTVAMVVIDGGAGPTNLTIDAKAAGTITIGGTSTGLTTFGHAVSLSSTLTYGGVTLTNAVTGTGKMVLDASPTLTGTPLAPTAAANTNTTQVATTAYAVAAIAALKVNVQVFTSSGTYTPSANLIYCIIECWGAGGGGGGAASATAGLGISGGGGGAGSYSRKFATAATIGVSQVATIGAAGTGATAGNNAGGAGGDTSIGVICVGKGATGGGGSSGIAAGSAGAGGVAGTGDVTTTGAPGAAVSAVGGSNSGGQTSAGASSLVGGGAASVVNSTSTAGGAGTGHASGGAGGSSFNSNAAAAGGAGTAGYIVVTEFCAH